MLLVWAVHDGGYDADTWYFLGTAYAQAKQYPQAIEAFEQALKQNPLHASAEFGISRAYQQSGNTDNSREHLKKFQYCRMESRGSTHARRNLRAWWRRCRRRFR